MQTRATTRTGTTYTVDASPALAQGTFTARAEQSDESSNLGQSSPVTFYVDTTPPTTTITAGPPDPSTAASANFSFTANEAGSTFRCSLDGAAFAVCTSPQGYSSLADGAHNFQVKATDAAGNAGLTGELQLARSTRWPRRRRSRPRRTIPRPARAQASRSASNEAGSTFRCSLDGAAFALCTSPKPYSGLADGTHTFDVKAVDPAGNTSSPATFAWRVDTTAPTIALTTPADGSETNDPTPTFAGTAGVATGDDNTVTIDVYSGSTPTGTPLFTLVTSRDSGGVYQIDATTPLEDGTYTARAQQADSVGNTGLSAANTFAVNQDGPDQTPPSITLATPESGSSTNDTTPTLCRHGRDSCRGPPRVTVNVYEGPAPTGTPIQTLLGHSRRRRLLLRRREQQRWPRARTRPRPSRTTRRTTTGFSTARTFTVDTTASERLDHVDSAGSFEQLERELLVQLGREREHVPLQPRRRRVRACARARKAIRASPTARTPSR